MARREFDFIDGPSGTTWLNDTGRAAYQLIASLVNTCGFCLPYHTKISLESWPVPFHGHCRCESVLILPGARAGNRFVDYAKLYVRLKADQRVAVVGSSNAKLIRAGLITVADVTNPERVRTLAEVVKAKRLSIKAMVKAGVAPAIAKRAYAEARLPGKLLAEQARRKLIFDLGPALQSQDDLAAALARQLRPASPRAKVIDIGAAYAAKLKRGLDAQAGRSRAAMGTQRLFEPTRVPSPAVGRESIPSAAIPVPGSIGERIRQSASWEQAQALARLGSPMVEQERTVHRLIEEQRAIGRRFQVAGADESAIHAEMGRVNRALEQAQEDYRLSVSEMAARAARRMGLPPDAPRMGWTHVVESQDETARASIERARRFVEGLVGRREGDPDSIELAWKRLPDMFEGRSFAFAGSRTTMIADGAEVRTAIHEWGHHLEAELPGAKAAAREFLEYRVGNEPMKSIGDAVGSAAFGDERGREDDFRKVFGDSAAYVGKYYKDGYTEVVSMGIERLHEDPAGFAAKDPEYAALILGILRGDLR